jgi:hypothetical protein
MPPGSACGQFDGLGGPKGLAGEESREIEIIPTQAKLLGRGAVYSYEHMLITLEEELWCRDRDDFVG